MMLNNILKNEIGKDLTTLHALKESPCQIF